MKILQVISGLQKSAGTSVFCGEIANQCVRQGHECDILVSTEQKNAYPIDSRIHLITKLSCTDYDVVHIHGLWIPWLHKQSNWAHHNNIPIIWSPHGMLAPWAMAHKRWKKVLPWYLYQKKDLQNAQMLHVTSDTEAAWCQDIGLTQAQLNIPLGSTPPAQIALHNSPCKRILFVGRIYPVKGLDLLFKAWAIQRLITSSWQLVIVGPNQAGYQQRLEELAKKLQLTVTYSLTNTNANICFTGPLFAKEKDNMYLESRCLVLPSYSENFGGVVIDALGYGLPVLTSAATPWKTLETYKCGETFDLSVESLGQGLFNMLSHTDDDRIKMGLRGRALVERKYTWPAIGEQMIKAYNELVDNKGLPK